MMSAEMLYNDHIERLIFMLHYIYEEQIQPELTVTA